MMLTSGNQPTNDLRRRFLAGGRAYRFNHDLFAFESFPDEIVALNLVDGIYYAFGGAAVVAWPFILAQHSEPIIAGALGASYGVPVDALSIDLAQFVGRLLDEKVLLTAPETSSEI